MPIRVELSVQHVADTLEPFVIFERGETWHSDGDGFLHVRDANKTHIGILAPGTWLYAAATSAKA